MALLINVRLEQLARTTEAQTNFKILSLPYRYGPTIIKLQEIFIFLMVHTWYHPTEHHP